MNASEAAARDLSKPVFWGFMTVGFLSLLGGILMFAYVVPKDLDANAPPRDVGVLFTEVFLKQLNIFEVRKRYAAALNTDVLEKVLSLC